MSSGAVPFDVASVLREVKMIRAEGLVRIRGLPLPLLRQAAAVHSVAVTDVWPLEVENLLRAAVSGLGGGELQDAAALTLGTAPGMRDRPAADRRRLAAKVYDISVERFRKSHEEMILGQVAEQVCWIAGTGGRRPDAARVPLLAPSLQHRALRAGSLALALHVHPVELLRDVDVIVSPLNTHLSLPEMYKASVPAALRRAGAVRDVVGDVIADPIHDELLDWRAGKGLSGRSVLPGTVVPTGAGALAARGVRRIYHAAVAVPRPGTNDYDVTAQDVTAAAARALALLDEERDGFGPPLRSVCFPLLGAGRGGLPPQTSVTALWAALAAGAARHRRVHLVVRRPALADLVTEVLGAHLLRPSSDESPENKEPWHRCL
jgi:O-acetyl-ADP-ribose deacetylase (regulator of RNase III)